ncbi:unnamed protein product [Boreogadus saida]
MPYLLITDFLKLEAALHNPVHCSLLGFSAASTSLPQGYLWVPCVTPRSACPNTTSAHNRDSSFDKKAFPWSSNALELRGIGAGRAAERGMCRDGEVGADVLEEGRYTTVAPDGNLAGTTTGGQAAGYPAPALGGATDYPSLRRPLRQSVWWRDQPQTASKAECLVEGSATVLAVTPPTGRPEYGQQSLRVSSLLLCQGLLWVGTAQGSIITLPVPKLEGIPKITGKGMVSLNAHCGPVDFLLASSSSLAPELLKRDSLPEGPDSAFGGDGGSDSASSQESLQPPGGPPPLGAGGRGVLLQYRLRSTSGLPGRPLTALGEGSASSLESLEHSVEDGSIYEPTDDPEMWVRGRGSAREGGRRDRVTSAAVVSGGRGFRRLREGGAHGTRTAGGGGGGGENTLMVWQLPLTV